VGPGWMGVGTPGEPAEADEVILGSGAFVDGGGAPFEMNSCGEMHGDWRGFWQEWGCGGAE